FTVPGKEGSIRNLTRSSGVREAQVVWSPDARWIAYVSDRSGEDEIYLVPSDGMGPEQQITIGYKGFKYQPVWSPDRKKLAWADKDLRLWYVDVTARKPVQIDRAKYGEIHNYSFSPDSNWLAFDKPSSNFLSFVNLYSLASGKITAVTSDMTSSYGPVFDTDGKYLYFLSDRDLHEVIGNIDFEFANPKTARVYIATLRANDPSPFPALSDEAEVKKSEAEPSSPTPTPPTSPTGTQPAPTKEVSKKQPKTTPPAKPGTEPKGADAEKPAEFHIDLDGLQQRIVAIPTEPAASIRTLAATKGFIYYSTLPIQGLNGPLAGEDPTVHVYDLKERKDKTLMTGVQRFALSFDGTKLLYEAGDEGSHSYGIIDAKPGDAPKKVGDGTLSLTNMRAEINPPEEWKQIYNEVWRQEREFFFEAAMNGVDWQKIHDKYAALLPFVSDRYTLTYIMGEMIGELSNSHTYVGGGDYPDLHPVNVGLLGADFELDPASGRYRIKKIYPGENWNAQLRSPLTEPGVNVKQGDYLLAINGRDLKAPATPYEFLVNTVNETVTLSVNATPATAGARNVQVKPIADEFGLHEQDWIEGNRRKIDAATNGKVGYVYLPDMGAPGLDQFVKQFFPQVNKPGMVFDVRYNGGGFVDQLIFSRLRRVLGAMQSARNWESNPVPFPMFNGSLICITNHYAASDGDFFSYFFKQYKLGPLIGERTWGGVRGIRGQIPLIDGGYITRPEFGLYGLDSKWLIENKGVQPDVVIENRPDLVVEGQDPQLEKAIEMILQDMQAHPKQLPARPPELPAYPNGPGM
ncbi:MAG: PDZ domain-containing protein, partial [Acidobacteriales bacterium]|nr:PDZ domain-containing protein [Terriglobales bacterium]